MLEAWTARHTAKPRQAETIREWATKHGCPHFRLNRSIFFDLPTLMRWLDGQRNPLRRSSLEKPKGD